MHNIITASNEPRGTASVFFSFIFWDSLLPHGHQPSSQPKQSKGAAPFPSLPSVFLVLASCVNPSFTTVEPRRSFSPHSIPFHGYSVPPADYESSDFQPPESFFERTTYLLDLFPKHTSYPSSPSNSPWNHEVTSRIVGLDCLFPFLRLYSGRLGFHPAKRPRFFIQHVWRRHANFYSQNDRRHLLRPVYGNGRAIGCTNGSIQPVRSSPIDERRIDLETTTAHGSSYGRCSG
jgi:hypothetical protein